MEKISLDLQIARKCKETNDETAPDAHAPETPESFNL